MSRAYLDYSQGREAWRVVEEFPQFEVSNYGRVRRAKGSVKKVSLSKTGYPCVGLWDGEKTNVRLVHQLVCMAFHGPRPDRHQVAHIDGNRQNNHSGNLRWATPQENAWDKYRHGTHLQGSDSSSSKLNEEAVTAIRSAPKGTSLKELADQYGVTRNHIAKIRTTSRGLWPHIPFPNQKEAGNA